MMQRTEQKTAPFGSPLPLDEHPFDSPDAENIQDPGPSAAEDTYEQYLLLALNLTMVARNRLTRLLWSGDFRFH